MNTDRTARTGDEAEQGVTHYAGGTANAFARALAYEVGCGANVYVTDYGVTAVEWKASGFRLAIEADANGWFHVVNALDECRAEYENMSLTRAAEVARGWLEMFAPSHVNGDDYIRHLEALDAPELQRRLEAAERQVHRLIHGEEIESDRICDHELRYANLRSAIIHAGLDPDELGRKHAEWIRNGARAATESFDELPFETREDVERELGDVEVVLAARFGVPQADVRQRLIDLDRANELTEDDVVARWHELRSRFLAWEAER